MGIVREGLGFERKKDPHSAIGIGRRALIENWLEEMDIKNWVINEDYKINIKGNLFLSLKTTKEFPSFIQFKNVFGDFFINGNKFISLRGCPYYIQGDFSCWNNNLDSLEYAPSYVEGFFACDQNRIKFTVEDVKKVCNVLGKIYV